MLRKLLVVGALVLVVATGAALATGLGPAPGGDSGEDIESFPTETPESPDEDGETGDDDATTTAGPPFTSTVDRVEECGQTCRDVTTTLTNNQSTADSNVTVYTRIYVGNGTDGDVAWEGTESVGHLDAGESYTTTKRVELSVADAYAVEQHDGWITVQTTVESDNETMTVVEQHQVI